MFYDFHTLKSEKGIKSSFICCKLDSEDQLSLATGAQRDSGGDVCERNKGTPQVQRHRTFLQ